MPFLKRTFGDDGANNLEADGKALATSDNESLAPIGTEELAKLQSNSMNSITIPVGDKAAAAADMLIPLAANAAQAAGEYGMAVVKFPEGVGWADLCVRHADGWNLLANFKDGKFNDMAAIKQAGLQPVAAANLALQGAAVAVGMAYMNQINDKLDGIQQSIEAIQRDMERERDAELEAAYNALMRLVRKYEEYGATPEKRGAAQQIVEDTLREADKAYQYQLKCMRDLTAEIEGKKKLPEVQIREEAAKLASMESRAAVAFQLYIAAQQVGMRLDNNYTERNIAKDQQLAQEKADAFSICHGDAQAKLSMKVSKIGGLPLALADRVEDDYKAANPALGVLHAVGNGAKRINPASMHAKAKADISEKRAKLQDEVSTENIVRELAKHNEEELESLRFAFNEADTLVIRSDNVLLLKSELGGVEDREDTETII